MFPKVLPILKDAFHGSLFLSSTFKARLCFSSCFYVMRQSQRQLSTRDQCCLCYKEKPQTLP